jgi:D-cysteine desulfhydrase
MAPKLTMSEKRRLLRRNARLDGEGRLRHYAGGAMDLDLDLERVELGQGPTPVRELAGLGADRGRAPVWIKDDGAYSPFGGNKARKLEWLLGGAVRRGKRTILTGGALGTNHGLATALFARRLGMRTVLVLVPQPDTPHVRAQMDRLRQTGAELHFPPSVRRAYLLATWLLVARASPPFKLPYFVPPGGSVPLGCVGYVQAADELRAQVEGGELPEPSHVVVALGSGGTAAGLAAGLKLAGLRSRLVCVLVNDLVRVDAATVARLARRTLRLLRRHGADVGEAEVSPAEIEVASAWLGAGYGHSTPEATRAIELLADREGLTLEPVYTAKAMAALLDLNRRGAFGDGPVLYWHTYGSPTDAPTGDPAIPGVGDEGADQKPGHPRSRRRGDGRN